MKILLTGASGFIGAAVCEELLAHGHEVAALVRGGEHWRLGPARQSMSMIVADLAQRATWEEPVRAFAPDGVAHLAWTGVRGADRDDPRQVANIAWTADLLEVCQECGTSTFLGAGSQAEYGPKRAAITESDATAPTTLYGETKLAAGRIGARIAQARGMRHVWMRIFSIYGEGDHPHWLIPYLIGTMLRGERPSLTAGEQLWDFLHIRDAAAAMRIALENPQAKGVYNLGSGLAPPLRQTIETIRDLIDPSTALGWGEIAYRPDQVMILQADIARIKMIGWEPAITLAEGLARSVEWYRRNLWIYDIE